MYPAGPWVVEERDGRRRGYLLGCRGTMTADKRTSAVDVAEQTLRQMLGEGRWTTNLPGVRVLAPLLEVSPQTASLAVARLVKDGWLISGGARHRLRIDTRQVQVHISTRRVERRLLFVTSEGLSTAVQGMLIVYLGLMKELSGEGWQVKYRSMGYSHSESAWTRWDQVMDDEQPDFVVAWVGRPALAEWAAARGIKIAFVGGALETIRVPMVSTSVAPMLEKALDELLKRGHRSVVFPFWSRAETTRRTLTAVMKRKLEAAGVKFLQDWNLPSSPLDAPEVVYDTMVRIWDLKTPSAMIFFDWREYVSAQAFFTRRGVIVPDDLSVVLLSSHSSMECHLPPLSHFEYSYPRIIRALAGWARVYPDKPVTKRYPGRWVEGASILPWRGCEAASDDTPSGC